MIRLIVTLMVVFLGAAEPEKQEVSTTVDFKGKVSTLSIPAEKLEGEWTGPTGLVVNTLNDLSDIPKDQLPLVEPLKKDYLAIGVVGLADFTYRKKSDPLQQVTVRVFIFDTEKSCKEWWKTKYEYVGWEKHYSKVAGVSYAAVDSTQTSKRMVALGNVWITCGAASKTDDHIKILEKFIEAVKGAGSTSAKGG